MTAVDVLVADLVERKNKEIATLQELVKFLQDEVRDLGEQVKRRDEREAQDRQKIDELLRRSWLAEKART